MYNSISVASASERKSTGGSYLEKKKEAVIA
jgi:hypothetical protein